MPSGWVHTQRQHRTASRSGLLQQAEEEASVTSPKCPVTFPKPSVTMPKTPVTLFRNTQQGADVFLEMGPDAPLTGIGTREAPDTATSIANTPPPPPGPQSPAPALPVRPRPLLARSGAPAHGTGPRLLRQRPGGRPARGPAGRHGTRSATPARALRLRDQAACHRRRCAGAALRRPAYRAGRDRPGGAAPRTATTAATANAMPPRQTSPTDRAPSSWRNCVPAARAWT